LRKNIPFPEKRDIFILFLARELVTDKIFHLACDPLCSKIRLTREELSHDMDTPIGKILISVGQPAPCI